MVCTESIDGNKQWDHREEKHIGLSAINIVVMLGGGTEGTAMHKMVDGKSSR